MARRPRIPGIITTAREHLGVNQTLFGRLFRMRQCTISLIETGARPWPSREEQSLDRLLNLPQDDVSRLGMLLQEGDVDGARSILEGRGP